MGHFSFIINPVAGEGKAEALKSLIPEYLSENEYSVFVSKAIGDAKSIAENALNGPSDTLVAVGGDGTINEIASVLVNTKKALGIIPAGSGNGLARNLGIPLDPDEALQQLISGSETSIDSGKWNDRHFFNLMGIGLEASVSKRFRERKSRGFMAYAIDTFTEYVKLKKYPFKIRVDDKELLVEAVQLSLCLGPQYGNEAYIAPLKLFNNGKLQLVILKEVKLHRLPVILPALFNQRFHELAEVETYDCTSFSVESEVPFLHLDAEVFPAEERIEVEILPKSLKVRY